MAVTLFTRLDGYAMSDPGNREGHPEDICNACFGDRRVVDHPGHELGGIGDASAKWPRRVGAIAAIVGDWLDRKLAGK